MTDTGSPTPRTGTSAGSARPAPRRPPAPTSQLATVTRLGAASAVPEQVPFAAVQGTLALDLALDLAPDLALVPPAPPLPAPVGPDLHLLAAEGDDRALRGWAATFAQATVEVLGGDRPVSQLLRWTSPRVYQDLERRVRLLARAAAAPDRMRTIRPQVRSVHLCRPAAGRVEVSVHVRYGQRSRAIAARAELRRGRWTCVALEIG